MAATDHPLKRLVSLFIHDFAAWLLHSPVRAARPLNVELPANTIATDQVFRVTLADGRDLVLHIEFQGAAVTFRCTGGCWGTCPG
jgi:predicted transposase YdaD